MHQDQGSRCQRDVAYVTARQALQFPTLLAPLAALKIFFFAILDSIFFQLFGRILNFLQGEQQDLVEIYKFLYLLAKFRVDFAEIQPSKVRNFRENSHFRLLFSSCFE